MPYIFCAKLSVDQTRWSMVIFRHGIICMKNSCANTTWSSKPAYSKTEPWQRPKHTTLVPAKIAALPRAAFVFILSKWLPRNPPTLTLGHGFKKTLHLCLYYIQPTLLFREQHKLFDRLFFPFKTHVHNLHHLLKLLASFALHHRPFKIIPNTNNLPRQFFALPQRYIQIPPSKISHHATTPPHPLILTWFPKQTSTSAGSRI